MSNRRSSPVRRTPQPQPQPDRQAGGRPRRMPSSHAIAVALIGAGGLILAAAIPTVIAVTRPSSTPPSATDTPSAPSNTPTISPSGVSPSAVTPSLVPLIAGDSTEFVKDITYPDMSQVEVSAHFIKKWELKNTGNVRWTNRYIVPDGNATGTCTYPNRVQVPSTAPGHTVIISVPVTAANRPQLCLVTWKMVNSANILCFPGYTGFWFEVQVVNRTRQ